MPKLMKVDQSRITNNVKKRSKLMNIKNTGEYKYVEPYATFVEIKAHMEN